MEQTEVREPSATVSASGNEIGASGPSVARPAANSLVPQACAACGTAAATNGEAAAARYVYAIGNIEPRFRSLSGEKEFMQATGRVDTKGLTDRQALHSVLSKPENRYLVRQLCWVMTIEGLETYIVFPRDPADFSLLVEALRPAPQPGDLDVVIGVRGPVAPQEMCNGLMVPIVGFDQIYSFDRKALIDAIPKPEKVSVKEFGPAAEELFDRIIQMTDNAGATDGDRAANYLAMRYHAIYANAAEAFARNSSLSSVEIQPSSLGGSRNVQEVIISYVNRTTDVKEKFCVRVDVTDEFPFLVTKLSPYVDRGIS